MRAAFFSLIRYSALPWILRATVQRRRVALLMYHDTTPERFEAQLNALRERYNIISLRDYVVAAEQGRLDSLPSRSIVITFDDGHRGNAELIELFRQIDVPPTIFLVSGVVGTHRRFWFKHPLSTEEKERLKEVSTEERLQRMEELGFSQTKEFPERQALSVAELDAMREVVDFQAHTVFHPILPECNSVEAHAEIKGCKEQLTKNFDLDIYAFAYPNGDFSLRDVQMVKDAGYSCAVTTQPGYANDETDLFRLPRFGMNDEGGVNEAIVKASGAWSALRPGLVMAIRGPRKVLRRMLTGVAPVSWNPD